MSYNQPPRFFSLNNKQGQSETTPAPAAPQFTSTENSLDLLIRAADNNSNNTNSTTPLSAASAAKLRGGGIYQDNPNNMASSDQQQPQLPPTDNNIPNNNNNNNNMTSANTDNNNSTLNNNDNQGRDMGLQQTFLQAMGNNTNNQGGQGGVGFNPPQQNNNNINNSAASQFNQLMAGVSQQQQQGGTPQPQNQLQGGMFQPQGGGLGGGMQQQQGGMQPQVNNGMLTQLVASLQAQQQAQQQAQVQAALSRAFGPGANQHNMLPQVSGPGGGMNIGGAQSLLQGLQGLANHNISLPGMNHHLNQNPQAMQQALAVQQQQQQQQNQVASQQGGSQHDTPNLDQAAAATNQAMASKQPPNANNATSSNQEANDRIAPHATGDELIKLQLDQERHNRMLQMVQHDRQERAMLANQEAMMKKMKKSGNIVGSVVPNLTKAGAGEPLTNDDVTSLYNQVAVNNNTLALQNNMLNANALAGSMGGLPQMNFPNNNGGGGIPQSAAHLQNNVLAMAASAGGMPDLAAKINSVSATAATAQPQQPHNIMSSRGAAIVPCRARGMPVDHNFKTAYFVIPDGIEHGDELMCSYPACRQAGVKFRYCLQCRVPVAKRNFRNRHRHGVPGEEDEWEDEESEEETNQDVCRPVKDGENGKMAANGKDEEDYTGVKKEHVLIIPGTDPAKKKKKRKSKRVPCRARGMPMAHNYKTAYFIIPPNVAHGDELLCSFPACRSAGAKFRYCLHCKVPVAKRNFRNRHRHGAAQPGGTTKKENLKTAETSDDKKKTGKEEDEGNKVTIESSHDANKVQKWVELLENKPEATDKSAMAVWMLNLMNATQGCDDNKPEAVKEDTTTGDDNKPKAVEETVPAPKEQTAGDAPPPESEQAAPKLDAVAASSVMDEEGTASSSSDLLPNSQPLKKRKTEGEEAKV